MGRALKNVDLSSVTMEAGKALDPNTIRFSQSSVNNAGEIIDSMRVNGWVGDAIDVVKMPDGMLTSLDNDCYLRNMQE